MYSFLANLINSSNYNEVAQIIDWLVNDDKFEVQGWDKNKTSEYTKEIKKIEGFKSDFYFHGGQKDLQYPKNSLRHFAIYMQNDGAECKDLVRHIRNGFAHGNVKARTISKEKFIEIYDYGKSNRTDKPSGQTAYILVPVNFIKQLYVVYERIRKKKK